MQQAGEISHITIDKNMTVWKGWICISGAYVLLTFNVNSPREHLFTDQFGIYFYKKI